MIGTLDSQVIEKFKEFRDKIGKYLDLDIEKVEFENIALSDEEYFEFIKGRNYYIKKYNIANKGKYPLATGSVKNDSIAYYVKPINIADIITQKCISFNKDGDSQIFYRDYEFLMDRHHIAIIPSELVLAKYLYFALISYFKKMKFGWGENVADVSTVSTHSVPIPKGYNENYKSIDIQKAIVDFLEYNFDNLERIKSTIDKRYDIVTKMKKSLIPSTFKRTAIQNRFRKYAQENNIEFDITDIEFDIKILKNISQKINSGATPKKINTNWTDINDINGIPWLDINRTEFEKFSIETYRKKITNIGLNSCSTWLVPKGAIMITIGGSLGFVGINKFDTCTNQNILNVILKSDYNVQYVMYVLENFYRLNIRNKTSAYGNLSKTSEEMREIFIPKDLENYTSYEIQQILANFIEHIDNEIDEKYVKKYNRFYEVVELLRETYLKRIFNKIVWS